MFKYDFEYGFVTVDENDVVKDTVIRYHEDYPVHEGRRAAYEVEGLFHRVMVPAAGLKNYYRKEKKQYVRTAAEVEARQAKCLTVYNQMMDIINALRAEEEKYLVYSWYSEIHAVEQAAEELRTKGYSETFIQDIKALALTAIMVSSPNTEVLVYDLIDAAQELYDTACYKPSYSFAEEYLKLPGTELYTLETRLSFYRRMDMMNPFYEKLERCLKRVEDAYIYECLRHTFFDVLYDIVELDISAEELELEEAVEIYNLKRKFLEMLTR